MDSTSGKRTAESEQTEETFAVCTNCSRLSYNLKTCDKCGSTLSEDNTAVCYSSEPKRLRTENNSTPSSTPTSRSGVNGDGRSDRTVNGEEASQLTSQSGPVPQALYANKNTLNNPPPGSGDAIRPQALYVNLNNQAYPVVRVQQDKDKQPSPTTRLPTPTASSGPSFTPAPPPYSSAVMANTGGPPLPSLNSQHLMQGAPRMTSSGSMLAVLNSQPVGSLSGPTTIGSHNIQLSTAGPQVSASQAQRTPVSSTAPAVPTSNMPIIEPNCLTVNAQQIRIGTRKFRPVSPVNIKDDGILFTLKVNVKRCITIFPIIPASSQQLHQNLVTGVRRIFDAMLQRYPRVGSIMDEITPDMVLDLLYGSPTPGTDAPPPQQVAGAMRLPAPRQAPPAHQQQSSHVVASDAQRHNLSNANPRHPMPLQSRPPTNPPPPGNRQQMIQLTNSNRSTAPLLVIPSDQMKWTQMQKNLVVGGVYHVQMSNGNRKYCLWNGSNLVPCLVHNTEVQLSCNFGRIGSLITHTQGPVKVKMDAPAGISFSVKTPKAGVQDVLISADDLIKCEVCFERVVALFIYPTWVAGQRLAQKLGLSKKVDPTYDPYSGEDRRKHLILFLKDVNQDQREALMQMKMPGKNKPLIEEIDVLAGRSILTKIKRNTMIQSKMDSYLVGADANNVAHQSLESLAREVTQSGTVATNTSNVDDDDDDVIMTSEEVGIKCPYTQQVMKDPVRNKTCGHNYEKLAIQEFIFRKKGNAKCPYAGCGNQIPLSMDDLLSNHHLKKYIEDNSKETSN